MFSEDGAEPNFNKVILDDTSVKLELFFDFDSKSVI